MACASVALLCNVSGHSYCPQARLNPDSSNCFTRSRVFRNGLRAEKNNIIFNHYKPTHASRFSNQEVQFNGFTKKTHQKPQIHAQANFSSSPFITEEIVNTNFFDRLKLAWKVIFPEMPPNQDSNAQIAKQRLKMVLFSDRCAVSDLAKKKILESVIKTLSEFVEIESRDKVQLNVSTDSDIGTVYSVSIPVRRVKPAYQEDDENYQGQIVGIEYKDTGETSGTVDVTFDFYVPDES